jgi:hypothetical protein
LRHRRTAAGGGGAVEVQLAQGAEEGVPVDLAVAELQVLEDTDGCTGRVEDVPRGAGALVVEGVGDMDVLELVARAEHHRGDVRADLRMRWDSDVVGWSRYDGTGRTRPTTGDSDEPPCPTGLAALLDGWRLFQASQLLPPQSGHEYDVWPLTRRWNCCSGRWWRSRSGEFLLTAFRQAGFAAVVKEARTSSEEPWVLEAARGTGG